MSEARERVVGMVSDSMAGLLPRLNGGPLADLGWACAQAIGMDGFTVSVVVEHRETEMVWSVGGAAPRFDDLQFTLGEGPGPDAVRWNAPVGEPDLAAAPDDRWPALLPAAARIPVRAVYGFPLSLGAIRMGVLTCCRSVPGAMTAQQTDDARALAEALTRLFLGGGPRDTPWVTEEPPGVLRRAVVHQATGMISVQLAVPLAEALLRLRAWAFAHERPIMEVAEDVVARRLRIGGDRDDNGGPDALRAP